MKTLLKCIYIIIGLMLSHYAYAASDSDNDSYFESKNYIVYLDTSKCLDTDIKCDVTYHGINKHNHHEITIKGSTINVGPSLSFRGYGFTNGKYNYTLTLSPDSEYKISGTVWILQVFTDKGTLVDEKGKWVDPK